jgi:hypothetical protein
LTKVSPAYKNLLEYHPSNKKEIFMRQRDWVLEKLHKGRMLHLWEFGFLGMGGIGPIRGIFPSNIVLLQKDQAGRLFRPPCCPLQAVAILDSYLRTGVGGSAELSQIPFMSWQEIASDLLSLSPEEGRAIVLAVGMTHGYDKNLRSEIIDELGLVTGPQPTLSLYI